MAKKNKRDVIILDLKKGIESKKEALLKSKNFKPKTNLVLKMDLGTKNLNVLGSNELLETLATIGHIPMVLKSLGINECPIIGNGKYTIDEWIHDIKGKYELSVIRQEEDKLKVMESKLDKLLSTTYKEDKAFDDLLADIKGSI